MGLTETIIFYLLIGAPVAVAIFLSPDQFGPGARIFRTASAVLFWPIYLPVLLQRPDSSSTGRDQLPSPLPAVQTDELAVAISQVEAELDSALRSLDGWAENVLAAEHGRFSELRTAWNLQAVRIRELDQLLSQPEFIIEGDETERQAAPTRIVPADNERMQNSRQARRKNIERMRQVRRQLYDDLLGTLAWVRELVTMIHLAKFTGAPASRAEELIEQIAAAVEGLSEVTAWQKEAITAI